MIIILTLVLLATPAFAQSPFSAADTPVQGGRQIKGLVTIDVQGRPLTKRFVLRTPTAWNGSLVLGAHGGGGGDAVDRAGKVYATSETALDDVIGAYALANGFAYASVDRDGTNGPDGADLTAAFAATVKDDLQRRTKRAPRKTYLLGLSAGGGIARTLAEAASSLFEGALLIAGAGGDVITRLDRQQRMAALWPLIDPRAHFGLADNDPKIRSYAEAIGTPVAARRLWPYTGASAVAAAARPAGTVENSTAQPSIPMMEVVGTWDDLVIREIRAYRDRVEPKDRHRLYQVEGVWHMSGNDDGVAGFQNAAESRMRLDQDVADAMGEGPSYIATVHDAFDALVRWVEKRVPPPASQTVKPGGKLR